jgi:type IV pilus assembly protein PilB
MSKTADLIKQLVTARVVAKERADELKNLPYAEDVFRMLREDKEVDQEKLTEEMAKYYNLKYIDLNSVQIDKEIINLLPEDLAQNYQLVVFGKTEGVWKAGLVNPADLKGQEAVDFLARQMGFQVDYYLISLASFRQVMRQYSVLKTEIKKALDLAEEKMSKSEKQTKKMTEEEKAEEMIKSAPISQIVSVIIRHGVEGKASDIHIEPFVDKSRVRYRIDGVLHTSLVLPKAVHAAIVSRIKVLSNLKIDETRIPQDGRIRLKVNNNDVDFRISTLPLYDQEKVVMRILDTTSTNFTLEKLGFEGKNLMIIQNNIDKPHGMFLVTGPTGSGKSTTLYAVLNILNQETVNIVTLEDPVEYYLKGVNQSQINPDVGLTFAAGLRSILRQDPNVVMVGEIRDNETAELAIHAALTGHTVLSTLHTNDSFGAIPRLIDMHVEPFLLVSTLNVIIAQRLVRKNCEKCKEEYTVPESLNDFVWQEFARIPKEYIVPELEHIKAKKDMKFYRGKGCPVCSGTGYAGRLAIAEVLDMVNELKQMISSGESLEKVRQEVVARNLCTLQQDGVLKALRGQTTVEEIMRATKE